MIENTPNPVMRVSGRARRANLPRASVGVPRVRSFRCGPAPCPCLHRECCTVCVGSGLDCASAQLTKMICAQKEDCTQLQNTVHGATREKREALVHWLCQCSSVCRGEPRQRRMPTCRALSEHGGGRAVQERCSHAQLGGKQACMRSEAAMN